MTFMFVTALTIFVFLCFTGPGGVIGPIVTESSAGRQGPQAVLW